MVSYDTRLRFRFCGSEIDAALVSLMKKYPARKVEVVFVSAREEGILQPPYLAGPRLLGKAIKGLCEYYLDFIMC